MIEGSEFCQRQQLFKVKKNGMRVEGELGSLGSGHKKPEYDRSLGCGQQRLVEGVRWG